MPKKIKLLSTVLAFVLFITGLQHEVCASPDAAPAVSARSAVLIDADSGKILYEKNAYARLPMASTTKIMTALIAVEHGDIDRSYTIPDDAVGVEGSSVYLVRGESLTMRQLVYALMLESANDAAEAIAIIIAGSTECFAAIMNDRASELGLEDTSFTNPHGLDDPNHYTTARDLAVLTSFALKHTIFREIVSTERTRIPFNNGEGVRSLVNHNKLLRSYRGAIGVKTGFTKRSGRCLVSAAERNGMTLIAVTINAPDDWRDHTSLLDFGFSSYRRITLAELGQFKMTFPVCGSQSRWVVCSNTQAVCITLPRDNQNISCSVEAPRFLLAPVCHGQVVGKLIYRLGDTVIAEVPICAEAEAALYRGGLLGLIKSLFGF